MQVGGKVKALVKVGMEDTEEAVREKVMSDETVAGILAGKNIVKEIYVKK